MGNESNMPQRKPGKEETIRILQESILNIEAKLVGTYRFIKSSIKKGNPILVNEAVSFMNGNAAIYLAQLYLEASLYMIKSEDAPAYMESAIALNPLVEVKQTFEVPYRVQTFQHTGKGYYGVMDSFVFEKIPEQVEFFQGLLNKIKKVMEEEQRNSN